MKTAKIVLLTVFVTVLIEAVVVYGIYKVNIQPKLRTMEQKTYGKLECYGSSRTGIMDNEEQALFNRMNELCLKYDAAGINSILDIKPDELELGCRNEGEVFSEPNLPVSHLLITNKSNRPIPLIDFKVENIRYSEREESGYWSLDYHISVKENPTFIKILKPGATYEEALPLDVRGYGKQKINYVLSYPHWTEMTSHGTSRTSIIVNRKACTYSWGK